MNNFDELIKEKAISEEIQLPIGFNERSNYLINDLISKSCTIDKRSGKHRNIYKMVAALFIACILLGSASVAADQLTGGDFFNRFFTNRVINDTNKDYSYMNTEQLKDISSSSVGTVINTDELTIEIIDVVISGNTANLMIKVTASELDSIFYDNGVIPLKNYRFYEEYSDLDENIVGGSIGYYYSDEDKSLEPNQLIIIYSLICENAFEEGYYTYTLDKFGYYNNQLEFVTIYNKRWQIKVAFDSKADYSREVNINQPVTIDYFTLDINSIKITPFTCMINFSSDTEYTSAEFKAFSSKASEIEIELKDGTILDKGHFSYTCSAEIEKGIYGVILRFNVPITVDDVKHLSVFGFEYAINN